MSVLRRGHVALLLVGLTMTACRGDGEAPASAAEEARGEAPADTATPADAADPGDPAEGLPASALAIVRQASRVEVGPLRIVAADEAEARSFASENRIAGYPVDGSLVTLPPARAVELRTRILDPGGYAAPPEGRCRNETMVGARFTWGEGVVELALGVECRQAIWAFPAPGEPGRWGATLGQETTARVLPLFSPESDP